MAQGSPPLVRTISVMIFPMDMYVQRYVVHTYVVIVSIIQPPNLHSSCMKLFTPPLISYPGGAFWTLVRVFFGE